MTIPAIPVQSSRQPGHRGARDRRRTAAGVGIAAMVVVGLLTIPTGFLEAFSASLDPVLQEAPSVATGLLGADWPTYLENPARDSAAPETILSTQDAANLTVRWTYPTGGTVVTNPVVSKGRVFVGSWDGYEYALDASNGTRVWRTFVGQTTACGLTRGVSSSATVFSGRVYLGGGADRWYALDRYNGSILWSVPTGSTAATGPGGGHYNWASPLIYGGFAYIGISSDCDHPLVRGALLEVNLTSQRIQRTFWTTPNGTLGATIWSSPTLDRSRGNVLVSTGNNGSNASGMYNSVVALSAGSMTVRSSWQVPLSLQVADGDFGATPTMFTTPRGLPLLVATNKDGLTFAFNATNLSRGPLWATRVSTGSTLAPAAYSGGFVYVGCSGTRSNPTFAHGALRALNASTGAIRWSIPFPGPVIGAPLYVNGLVIAGGGDVLRVVDASNGHILYSHVFRNTTLLGAPSVSHGFVYVGTWDGNVTALALKGSGPVPGFAGALSFPTGLSPDRVAVYRDHSY